MISDDAMIETEAAPDAGELNEETERDDDMNPSSIETAADTVRDDVAADPLEVADKTNNSGVLLPSREINPEGVFDLTDVEETH